MASYKDLGVYRKSYALVLEVYTRTKGLPIDEQYGLQGQMRRAAVSIPLNIAEGYGRQGSTKEVCQYLRMARGSSNELEVLAQLAGDLGYLEAERSMRLAEAYAEIGRMLTGLAESLTKN